MAEIDVLKSRFEDHLKDEDGRYAQLRADLAATDAALEGKASYRVFMLVLSLLLPVLGFITWQLYDIREKTTATAVEASGIKSEVAGIKDIFERYDITIQK